MNDKTKKMVLAGLFLAVGLLLPFLTGQVPALGNRLLPMHIPVLLGGFFCGGPYGLLLGLLTPLLRSLLFGMPVLFPIAVTMAVELAAYGFFAGELYRRLPKKNSSFIIALLGAMIIGRIVWGIAAYVFYGLAGIPFSIEVFVAGSLLNAIPGIVIQLVLIPAVLIAAKKAGQID
jgi:thiamine transporter ThiT